MTNGTTTSWTEERTKEVIQKWKDGYSAAAIAKSLGVSRGAVMGRLYRLGIIRKRSELEILRPITLPKLSV